MNAPRTAQNPDAVDFANLQHDIAALRAENQRLRDALSLILGAHDSGNNGAYMGEAKLCPHYAEKARAALKGAE